MDNKNIFASNLKQLMKLHNKTRRQICADLKISYYTFSDWVNGKKYPRMDKVEQLANYFGILKSDLIEEKSEDYREMQKENDIITDAVLRMTNDSEFFSAVEYLLSLNKEQIAGVKQLLSAFQK